MVFPVESNITQQKLPVRVPVTTEQGMLWIPNREAEQRQDTGVFSQPSS